MQPQSGIALLLLAAVVGYLMGSISPAMLFAKRRGVDIRAEGSGNPGATNVGRVMGARTGVVVGLLDIVKGWLPTVAFAIAGHPDAAMVAGLAAVIGHVTSPWLSGRGGKGVATSFGAILGAEPWLAMVVIAVFALVAVVTRWIALASGCAALALVIAAALWYGDAWTVLWAASIAAVILVRHRANYRQWRTRLGVKGSHGPEG